MTRYYGAEGERVLIQNLKRADKSDEEINKAVLNFRSIENASVVDTSTLNK